MKSKKSNKHNLIIAILTVIIAIAAIFTLVPMQFGDTTYTGVWGKIGMSPNVYGGMYAEYDISGDASHDDIVDSMGKIKSVLQEQGYQSTNVFSIDDEKIRVEIGYPTTATNSFSQAISSLNDVAVGKFELRSSSDSAATEYVAVNANEHVKKFEIADYNGTTFLVVEFNKDGEKKFEKLCTESTTISVFMGGTFQTSFSAENVTDYSQMQLSITDYESAKDFYFKAKFGALSIDLNKDTIVRNTMTSSLNLGTDEGMNAILIVLVCLVFASIIAGFAYYIIKYKMAGILYMPIFMLNVVVALWVFTAISSIEISVTSLIAIIFGITLIFGESFSFMRRVEEEYIQGKTIDASIEAGTKKARPAILITNLFVFVLALVLAFFVKGELASANFVIAICSALSAISNAVILPWFIKLFNKSNKKQGKPYGLKQQEDQNV